MTSAFRRGLTWVLCLVGMAAGSLAWTAGVYLHTWADPTSTTRVTEAVLADPEASQEVLAPVSAQIVAQIPPELGIPSAQIDAALDQVVADPAARARIADAFVTPDGDLHLAAASEAFRDELIRQQPALAPVLESSVPTLSLPDLSTATSARNAADLWVWRLGVLAAAAFALSFAFGDRRRTARRFGYWSIGSGVLWLVGPLVAAWLAPRVTGRLDATATIVVREYTRPIGPWALGLTIAGLAALAGSFLVPAPRDGDRRETAARPDDADTRPARRPVDVAPGPAPSVAATQTMPVASTDATTEMQGTERTERTERTDAPGDRTDGDVDVWAAYESAAPSAPRPD